MLVMSYNLPQILLLFIWFALPLHKNKEYEESI